MEKIDLSTNSKKIKEAYEKVVRGDPSFNYVVYTVDKNSSLEVSESGDGSLDEFIEHFEDGNVQFGLARVIVPGSDVSKNLLVGWCPDNAPAKSRLSFANNFADVSNALSGYHVQVTARDQDDLDADEFLRRVSAAAGARYSTQSSSKPVPKPVASKPIVAKSAPKPAPSKPSVPKSTGKPIAPITPKPIIPKPAAVSSSNDDGWGDEKEIEERDFEKKPLEDVPSAYKPTKVDISELRKQKSDTISSQPKPFVSKDKSDETKKNDDEPKSLSERMKTFKSNDTSDGRLTSLPKPKVNHSVASRFSPANTSSEGPSFGSKPAFSYGSSNDNKKDKLVGGLSRNFAAEGGKTPAQLWAEKRGQYKSVEPEDNTSQNETSELVDKFSKNSVNDDEEESSEATEEPTLVKPSTGGFPAPPQRNLPPRADKQEEEQEEEEEEKQEEEEEQEQDDDDKPFEPPIIKPSTGGLPTPPKRNLPPRPEEPEEEEEEEKEEEKPSTPVPSLPARNLPPPPVRTTEPKQEEAVAAPSKPTEEKSQVITAIAEYDYEKDEDNEIEFAEGDLITEIEFVDEEWWSGKHSTTGDVGLFPASYVSLQNNPKKESSTNAEKSSAPEASSVPSSSVDDKKSPSATAEYDYEKDEDNEISFAEGDKIVEIEFIDEDWWSGKHSSSGEVGLFPANYVKLDQ
ncbi:uncharacterized protein AC631_00693 [Debaryomyces fabryi]|uniref:Actin-binding protein n=1 Tax=Debaryomyces fabryi TaxID=58627 RepID=A0A0V1Q508_9ASCO|nr:uncharacterized protein AC631_00693 [Debaryomyces fabryi]KSA03554.1 hypothetical protein AC631_00693 [Debaryomyces fabryi]CUM54256.1 unnamed protein product [Debaryomyces fabryi]